jgi:hypothetical protein
MDYDPPSFCILYPGLTKDYKKVYSFYRYVIDVEGDRKKRGHTTPEEIFRRLLILIESLKNI